MSTSPDPALAALRAAHRHDLSTPPPLPAARATRSDVRNLAIIAHVDHGKTTLVDGLLRQAGTFRTGEVVAERAMDSNDLERERGITILSKCTSVTWNGVRVNLVDTPGHADFGGEVERVLGMVDAVLLLVDAAEGAMPQTRFVTDKAFELGLPAIVVVNKIDRPRVDPDSVVDQVFDLFVALGASDTQLDFPVVYASGREGWAVRNLEDPRDRGLAPLLDLIVEWAPPAAGDVDSPFCMRVATLTYDDYLGYLGIGRVDTGSCVVGDRLLLAQRDGSRSEFRVQRVLGFQGLKRFELAKARAGDIVALCGMDELNVGETITSISQPRILPPVTVDAPTMSMDFRVNDGPFAGKEGKWVTSRNLRERLYREVKSNIALRVEDTDDAAAYQVSGRGELHLSILIETMRREGFELCVSQPRVIMREEDGRSLEPFENVVIDLDDQFAGPVIEELGRRLGQMTEMRPSGPGRQRLEYLIPARGLIGYRSQFLTVTRGTGVFYSRFAEYKPYAGTIRSRTNGVLIAQEEGMSNAYALYTLQERGALMIGAGVSVYGGMIVGEHSRDNDLTVNPCKTKKLTNIRTHAADEKLVLTPPRQVTLESALEFINADELVEVTPKSIRLRKSILDHNARKRAEKVAAG